MLEQGFYAAEMDGLRAHPAVRSVRATNSLSDVARGEYDALLSYFYSHSAAGAAIARLRGKPCVATGGGEQVFRGSSSSIVNYGLRLTAFQLTAIFASRILATSTTDWNRMRQLALLSPAKIELSFHGAPAVDRFTRSKLGNSRNPGSLVTICGLDSELNVRRKGVLEAVELLARFVAVWPDSSLTIIGRTTFRSLVEERAKSLGVESRLRFAGYVSEAEKVEILENSRHYIQLSEYEGFGIGALEALACGCHVIHTGVGGLADTVGDFGTAIARDEIGRFDPTRLGDYSPSPERLEKHLAKFTVGGRAEAILDAMAGARR